MLNVRSRGLVGFVTADRRPELPQPLTERTAGARKPLGPEHQEENDEDENQVGRLKDRVKHGGVLSIRDVVAGA
jgi:hypothetical protein